MPFFVEINPLAILLPPRTNPLTIVLHPQSWVFFEKKKEIRLLKLKNLTV
nr:MAG TPA: hypothetical protein [Caudoviricetes sp.]